MGSNPGELLGAQDGQPSFSSSVSSSFSCLTKFFLKLVWAYILGRITWQLLFQDRRGGPSNFPWLTGRGMQMIPKRWILWQQSRNEILRSIPQWYFKSLLNSIGWSSYFNEKPRLVSSRFGPSGWLVSSDRQRLIGCVQNEYQEDVQPYESGIDDTLLQWLARVVLPRVLRFPPTKEKWKRWKDGGFPPGSPVSTH